MRAPFLAVAMLVMPSAVHAQSPPRRELTGMVAVQVVTTTDGSPADRRVCGADSRDMERRALSVLGRTPLVAAPAGEAIGEAVRSHPDYQRLLAARQAAREAARRAAEPDAMREARRDEEAASAALSTWEEPPILILSSLLLQVGRGVCAEYISLEVTSPVEPTRVVGTGASTTASVTLFLRGSLISGSGAGFRERRGRVIDELLGDFVTAWADRNRSR